MSKYIHEQVQTKKCTKCGEEKPRDDFSRRSDSPDGLRGHCKACKAEASRAWYAANRERAAESARAWREANPERTAVRMRAWYEANRERHAKNGRAWREENREYKAEMDRAWREENRERVRARSRAWKKANPEKVAEYHARERTKYPDRYAARTMVSNAIKLGKLPAASTQVCVVCGEPAQEYHHHLGYAREHWLDVIAVCIPCHKKADAEV